MINTEGVKQYCKDDISLIENYDKAIADNEMWHCHHRLETIENKSQQDLKNENRYYHVSADELIFLTPSEHMRLHAKPCPDYVKKRLSELNKGNIRSILNQPNRKPVAQYTKSGILIAKYNSVKEAARKMMCPAYSIRSCCKGKQKTVWGYVWKYL